MTENNAITPHEQGALIRYAAVSYLQQLREQDIILAEALRQAAARPWADAITGKRYAIRTLEDWWYNYQNGGFQALTNSPRKDAGQQRSTFTPELQEWVLTQRQQYPLIPVKVAYLRWIDEGKELPSLSVIYRFLQAHGYHRGRPAEHDISGGPSKAFEAPYPNDLWMTDFSPGPRIITADGKIIDTHLGALIDDHSRLLPYAAYYANENTQNFHHALKQGIRRRGVPHKLYADNGSPFISNHTHIVCANLGIRLLHHKPYAAWSKGKIERVFSSIQLGFETILALPEERVQSLEELNTKFSHWLQTVYHNRQHSSTGTTPQARFQAGAEHLRQLELSENALDKLFQTRAERTVRKNGIIRINNKIYEVDLSLRGRRVEVRYDPFAPGECHPEIYHKGHYICTANPVDLHLNSQLNQRRDYNDHRRS
jgi:transposase InsO family protein